jgi:cysteine desulfurase / selenocysteine lyase
MTPSERARLWADTSGVAQRIHLNNCGAALLPRPAIDAVHGHIDLEASGVGGCEGAGLEATRSRRFSSQSRA